MDLAADLASEARMHARKMGAQAVGGVKAAGSDVWRQLIGGNHSAEMTPEELSQKQEAVEEADKQDYLETRARVQAIYDEYRAKRQREEQSRQQVVEQQETKKIQELNSKRIVAHDVAVAMGKGSAETGRNYGAE